MTRRLPRGHQKISPPPLSPFVDEHHAQVELMGRARFSLVTWGEAYSLLWYLHAVPNGGYRPIKTALDLLDEGEEAGVLDLAADVRIPHPLAPNGFWSGIKIELKHGKNPTSPEQRWWMDAYRRAGLLCCAGPRHRDRLGRTAQLSGLHHPPLLSRQPSPLRTVSALPLGAGLSAAPHA